MTKTITLTLTADEQRILTTALTRATTFWNDRAYAVGDAQSLRFQALLDTADLSEALWFKVKDQL
jgi:hypothetical protein